MTFTIILPTYHEPELALHTLHTILQQRGVGLNVIICDDSRDDCIRQHIDTLADSRVRYIKNTSHLGAASNWNNGLEAAQQTISDAIIIMHHDDAFASADALLGIAKTMEQTNADIIVSIAEVERADGTRYRVSPSSLRRFSLRHPATLFLYNTIGPCAAVTCRPDCIQFFDERLHWFVDVDWYCRLLSGKGRSVACDTIAIRSHHGHEGQITGSLDVCATAKADASVLAYQPHITLAARLAIWCFIHVLHNATVNRIIKILLRR